MVHFVLVHGVCHGAWCWYKVKPVLESAGHRVTALDLAASGMNMAKIEEVHTMADYTQPLIELLDLLPPGEKVTLVGHSLGGFNLALAMDIFPHKISAAVFLAALMPDSTHSPSYVLDQDLALAKMLMRPGCLFQEDLSKLKAFSKVGYGSINQVFIVCKKDVVTNEDYQRWMIENNPVKEVMEIEDADHMAMMSKPNELCCCLLDIANKYT